MPTSIEKGIGESAMYARMFQKLINDLTKYKVLSRFHQGPAFLVF